MEKISGLGCRQVGRVIARGFHAAGYGWKTEAESADQNLIGSFLFLS